MSRAETRPDNSTAESPLENVTTTTNRILRQPLLRSLWFVVLVGALALSVLIATGAAAAADNSPQTKPTIVLVHGACRESRNESGRR